MTNFVHSKDALQLQRPSSETVFGLVFEGTPQMVFGALGIQWCWTSGWNGFIPCLDTHMKALNHWGRIGNCWNRSPRCWRTFADRNSHRIYTVNKESAKYHQKSRIVSDIKITLNYIYIYIKLPLPGSHNFQYQLDCGCLWWSLDHLECTPMTIEQPHSPRNMKRQSNPSSWLWVYSWFVVWNMYYSIQLGMSSYSYSD